MMAALDALVGMLAAVGFTEIFAGPVSARHCAEPIVARYAGFRAGGPTGRRGARGHLGRGDGCARGGVRCAGRGVRMRARGVLFGADGWSVEGSGVQVLGIGTDAPALQGAGLERTARVGPSGEADGCEGDMTDGRDKGHRANNG